jgi:arylsulfate sulfotransferase
MSFKINSPFVYCLCIFSFILFLNRCGESKPKAPYSIEAVLNPYRIAPLTAVLNIKSLEPCIGSVKVLGETSIEHSFEIKTDSVSVPVLGLYPNTENNLVVTLKYASREIIDTVKIKTTNIPIGFPEIEINKIDRSKMESGMHGCDIHYANNGKFNSIPMIFDDQGKIRWYLDLSYYGTMVSPFQRLKDGTLLMVDRFTIYEFDMLGKILKQTKINNNYGMHHDVAELPNGDLLICVGKRDAYINVDGEKVQSDSDFIMHYDRTNHRIAKEWDLAKHLDVTRSDVNFLRKGDWLHMNGLAFDKKDSTIVVSGKNQGLIKVSWNDDLKWIMAPKKNWGKSGRNNDGKSTQPYLLTAINSNGKAYNNAIQLGSESALDFDYAWGSHAPELLANGNILVFDNGSYRNFNKENNYSRAVEYKINEETKTVEQIWQYGKERGEDFYSEIVSDVDFLPNTNNILVTSGFLMPDKNYSAKIIEVNYATGEEVFEATLYYKTLRGNKTGAWGQSDILYRSERMQLKY